MHFGPVKREAGVSPARTRRCKRGAVFPQAYVAVKVTGVFPGRRKTVWILKSEDLPGMVRKRPRVTG